jgi:hypothetical protein
MDNDTDLEQAREPVLPYLKAWLVLVGFSGVG